MFNEWLQSIHDKSEVRSAQKLGNHLILQCFEDCVELENDELEPVSPIILGQMNANNRTETTIEQIRIEIEDIQEEIDYQNSSIICYVVGVNPPLQGMEGSLHCIQKIHNIDKVAMIKK